MKNNHDNTPDNADQRLLAASEKGNIEAIKKALSEGADINVCTYYKESLYNGKYTETALHWTCRKGHEKTARFLIEHGADPNIRNNHGQTPLNLAVLNRYVPLVKLLVENGANVNNKDDLGSIPLNKACYFGNREIMTLLLEHGAVITDATIGSAYDDYKLIRFLKEWAIHHAAISDCDKELMLAALDGSKTKVTQCIKKGADVNARDLREKLAVDLALEGNHRKAAIILEIAAITILPLKQADKDLLIATLENDQTAIHEAFKNGADDDVKNQFGNTALMLAAEYNKLLAAKTLINEGVNVDTNDQGYTALIWAASSSNLEIAQLLVEHKADPNIVYKKDLTALSYACHRGDVDIVRLLLLHGADVSSDETYNAVKRFAHEPEISRMLKEAHAGHKPDITKQKYSYYADCHVCKTLPHSQFADIMGGDSLPEQIDCFQIFGSRWHQIRKCPHCGTYYYYEYDIDNEIFHSSEDESLQRISPEQALAKLQKMKEKKNPTVKREIEAIIKSIPQSIIRFEDELQNRSVARRQFAVRCLLEHYTKKNDHDAVGSLLTHRDKVIRNAALSKLSRHNHHAYIDILSTLLSHEDPRTRYLTIILIVEHGNGTDYKKALPALIKALSDKSPKVRKQAIFSISEAAEHKIDISEAIPMIRKKPHLRNSYWGLCCLIYHYSKKHEWKKIELLLKSKNKEISRNTKTHLRYIKVTAKAKKDPAFINLKAQFKEIGSLNK